MNTHKILANNILDKASEVNKDLIDRKRFIWGNIKPDYVSKYKLKKHFYDESIDMIIYKIKYLSSLSEYDICYIYGRKKFSAELGVICHFLCDYFCFAHNKRWRFKKHFKKHVSYEKKLSKYAKNFDFENVVCSFVDKDEIRRFIDDNIKDYEESIGLDRDLIYALFICNSIVNTVLNQIEKNNVTKKRAS